MNKQLGSLERVPQSTKTGQLIPTNTELYNPATWLKTGYSPSEIILSIAVLVHSMAILRSVFK
jgi:hypothetical protein